MRLSSDPPMYAKLPIRATISNRITFLILTFLRSTCKCKIVVWLICMGLKISTGYVIVSNVLLINVEHFKIQSEVLGREPHTILNIFILILKPFLICTSKRIWSWPFEVKKLSDAIKVFFIFYVIFDKWLRIIFLHNYQPVKIWLIWF